MESAAKLKEQRGMVARHHAECHARFDRVEQHMLAAAPLVPTDTPEGAAWHARLAELQAWRAAMYDPDYAGNDEMIREFLRDHVSS